MTTSGGAQHVACGRRVSAERLLSGIGAPADSGGCGLRSRWRGGGRRRRHIDTSTEVAKVLATGTATGGRGIVLRRLVAAVNQLLLAQPLVMGGRVALSAHSAHPDQGRASGQAGSGTLNEEIEAFDVDGWAASHAMQQREGVGVGARTGEHREETVSPRAQPTHVGGVEHLLGPQQHVVADLEYRVDPIRIELRLPVCLRRREQLLHPLRAVRGRFAGGEAW